MLLGQIIIHWKFSFLLLCNIWINFLVKNFKFHSNGNIGKNTLSYFSSVYKDKLWSKYYSNQPSLSSTILS